MKVKDVIEALQKFDPEAVVYVYADGTTEPTDGVEVPWDNPKGVLIW